MDTFFDTIPGVIVSIGGILAVVIIGIMYVIGLWKGKKDQQDDRLIKILEDTVKALEKKVNDQKKESDETVSKLSKKIDDLTNKVDELERENKTLVDVLQGRDKATIDFQKQMLETVRLSIETNGLAKQTSDRLEKLIGLMTEHLETEHS